MHLVTIIYAESGTVNLLDLPKILNLHYLRTEGEGCHLALSSQLCDEMELRGPIFVQNTRSLSGSRNAGILSQKALANPWKELSYFSFAGIPVKGDIPPWGQKRFLC